jgi:hypothetical protein
MFYALPLTGHLISDDTVSLKRYPDTNRSTGDAASDGRRGQPRLYYDSTQSNERVTAFFQK